MDDFLTNQGTEAEEIERKKKRSIHFNSIFLRIDFTISNLN